MCDSFPWFWEKQRLVMLWDGPRISEAAVSVRLGSDWFVREEGGEGYESISRCFVLKYN